MFYEHSPNNLIGTVDLATWPMDPADGSCEQMHEGTVLEMKKNELQNIGPAIKRGLMGSWSKAYSVRRALLYIFYPRPGERPLKEQ